MTTAIQTQGRVPNLLLQRNTMRTTLAMTTAGQGSSPRADGTMDIAAMIPDPGGRGAQRNTTIAIAIVIAGNQGPELPLPLLRGQHMRWQNQRIDELLLRIFVHRHN